jgi:hypothetical protein
MISAITFRYHEREFRQMERSCGTSGGSCGRNDTLVERDHGTIDDGTVLHWYGIHVVKFHLDNPSLIAPSKKLGS